jgi:hypothetical protein
MVLVLLREGQIVTAEDVGILFWCNLFLGILSEKTVIPNTNMSFVPLHIRTILRVAFCQIKS